MSQFTRRHFTALMGDVITKANIPKN